MNPPKCGCFFCAKGAEHPARHKHFEEISPHLLKSESLNPADMIRMESCMTCGHRRPKEVA